MPEDETAGGVDAFFASYRAAFERLDAAAIADHFAFPGHVTSDAAEVNLATIPGGQEWSRQIERLIGTYRMMRVASARMVDLALTELSPRLVVAAVRWELSDDERSSVYAFEAVYTLALIDGRFRIVALAHNEIPRIRAWFVAHGAEGAPRDPAADRPAGRTEHER